MQPFPVEPAETTYAITVDANNEAAERWFAQADETTLTQTLAGARDLARDIGLPLVLRDAEGFLRGHVDADGGYRMVDCETHDLSATRSLIPSVLRGFGSLTGAFDALPDSSFTKALALVCPLYAALGQDPNRSAEFRAQWHAEREVRS